jgi:ribonuclease HI
MKSMKMILHTDGGARGNPGPSAAGVVLSNSKKKVVKELGSYLGICTNNEAEYKALILGLEAAKKAGAKEVKSYLDSELIVKQLNGEYKVKSPNMKKLWLEVQDQMKAFEKITYAHVFREKNVDADRLVNEVLDAIK